MKYLLWLALMMGCVFLISTHANGEEQFKQSYTQAEYMSMAKRVYQEGYIKGLKSKVEGCSIRSE